MLSDSTRLSIAILKDVIAGTSYASIAQSRGLTRTAAEHRAKRMARELLHHVGIDGLGPEAVAYAHKLRARQEDVLAAIAAYESGQRKARLALLLTDKDVSCITLRLSSKSAALTQRDIALVLILFATGIRPLEVARLEVREYLNPDGTTRGCSVMRAEASVNRTERPLFFQSSLANEAIDRYLGERRQRDEKEESLPYRGFDPLERIFMNEEGTPFEVRASKENGGEQYLCRQILDVYRRIFGRIGMEGLNASVIRRYVALRLNARGATEKQIGEILGINDLQAIRKMLPRLQPLERLMVEIF